MLDLFMLLLCLVDQVCPLCRMNIASSIRWTDWDSLKLDGIFESISSLRIYARGLALLPNRGDQSSLPSSLLSSYNESAPSSIVICP